MSPRFQVNVKDVESTLDNVVFLYGYIQEKDVFERDYQVRIANHSASLCGHCPSSCPIHVWCTHLLTADPCCCGAPCMCLCDFEVCLVALLLLFPSVARH